MPRVRRKGNKVRTRAGETDREVLLEQLNGWGLLRPESILGDVPEPEATEILTEARRRYYAARHERRLPVLRERLQTWPVDMWGTVFCEQPDLLAELSEEKQTEWRNWLVQHRRGGIDAQS